MQGLRRCGALMCLCLCAAVFAGAQSSNGQIQGTVSDSTGARIPGATLVLLNASTGVAKTIQSGAKGEYLFPLLPPGSYSLAASEPGFAPVHVSGLVLVIGQTLTHEFTLHPGATTQEVTVSANAAPINTTTPQIGGVITQQQIQTLPINSRQYLALALLMPGTGQDSSRSFFTSVNIGGSETFNSTGNIVDGTRNSWDEDGEPRQDIPEDAVDEFKLSNGEFGAKYGEATGGVVEVVTKSGTNRLHGDAFEYFRNRGLNARGPFEATNPPYRRNQFGGSIGGPILKDHLFFFGAFERTAEDNYFTVNAPAQYFSAVDGTFVAPNTINLYDTRLDWHASPTEDVFARFAGERQLTQCAGCGGQTAASAGYDEWVPRQSLVIGATSTYTSTQVNDFRFQYASGGYYIAPHGTEIWRTPGSFPAARIARLETEYSFPDLDWGSSFDEVSNESRWEVNDTYAISHGSQDIQIGGSFSWMPYFEENTGNPKGSFIFGQDESFNPTSAASLAALTNPIQFQAGLPPIHTAKPTKYLGFFVQDNWHATNRLTLDLGLRWERLYGSSNEDLNPNIFPIPIPYINVASRGSSNNKNFGPHAGFAWDLFGNGTQVVRGGYGIYYGHVRILGNLSEYRNFKQYSVFIANPSYPDPYGGKSPIDFATSGPANLTIDANNYRQPYAQVYSLGTERNFGNGLALDVNGIYNFTLRDRKIRDINAPDPVTGLRPNPVFAKVMQQGSSSKLEYAALYTTVKKHFVNGSQLLVSYTYTHSYDNNPLSDYINMYNLQEDWGPSSGERRNGLVASGSFRVPANFVLGLIGTWKSSLPWSAMANTFVDSRRQLVPGVGRNTGSRDLDLAAVNAYRATNGKAAVDASQIMSSRLLTLDAKLSRTLSLTEGMNLELGVQAFNLLNTTNFGASYNGGRVTNALSSSFGMIQTAQPARQVELEARFSF